MAFARRLGYRGNPIADWEAGRRAPTAAEALRACRRVGIDVQAAFARFHPKVRLGSLDDSQVLAAWLSELRGSVSNRELAERSGASRHQVARWLRGQSQPRLPEFLSVLEATTGRATDLLVELVPPEAIPSARAEHERRRAARDLAHEEPWTEAILRVLECAEYLALQRHRSGFIAERLGISVETESRCLEKLAAAGVAQRRRGRYAPVGSLSVETHGRGRLREHWAQVAAARARSPGEGDLFGYNVLSASRADVDRIEALLRATHREIRNIVEHTDREEATALVNLQLVRWG